MVKLISELSIALFMVFYGNVNFSDLSDASGLHAPHFIMFVCLQSTTCYDGFPLRWLLRALMPCARSWFSCARLLRLIKHHTDT